MSYYVKLRLTSWGRWGKWGVMGYPSTSAHCKEPSSYAMAEPPPDVAAVETIVIRAEPIDRQTLIAYYCQGGGIRESATRVGISKTEFGRRLKSAECYVEQALDSGDNQS